MSQVFYPGVTIDREVKIPMRDGIHLCADIYRPTQASISLPVLLMRLPYGKTIASTVTYRHPSWYAAQGYIVVIQEVRGCGRSEGVFYPFRHEYEDGEDTIAWCAQELAGSSGKVGMYGFSYQGVTQFQAAVKRPQGLITICPAMATADFYEGWFYFGGALCWEFVLTWALQLTQMQAQFRQQEPLATQLYQAQQQIPALLKTQMPASCTLLTEEPLANFYQDWIAFRTAEAWRSLNPISYFDSYDLPALHIGGWFDPFISATWNTFIAACKATKQLQKFVVGPWQHMPWRSQIGNYSFGKAADRSIDQLQIDWFDFWLKEKDNGIAQRGALEFFLMGENRWQMGTLTPNKQHTYYLHPQELLAPYPCKEPSTPDIYVYDPRNPYPITAYGPHDQSSIDTDRWDRVVYQSELLLRQLRISGVVECVLIGATSAPDTDWVVKLMDITPEGQKILITLGVLRARHSSPTITAHTKYTHHIFCRPTCYALGVGHRFGITIASGAFPLIERHSNTGENPSATTVSAWQEATQMIYHNSYLLLPIGTG